MQPLKCKSGSEVTNAFGKVSLELGEPMIIQSDKGKEMYNSAVKSCLKLCKVQWFSSKNDDVKCAMVDTDAEIDNFLLVSSSTSYSLC